MRNPLSQTITTIPPSGIRKFFDIVSEMKDAISLGVGEPDFVTPWTIRDVAIKSIKNGHTHYPSNHGMPELRKEICAYLSERYNVHYDLKQTFITVGAWALALLGFSIYIKIGNVGKLYGALSALIVHS